MLLLSEIFNEIKRIQTQVQVRCYKFTTNRSPTKCFKNKTVVDIHITKRILNEV